MSPYVSTGRNNRAWGCVEGGIKDNRSPEQIISEIEKIEDFSKGHWHTLVRKLEKHSELPAKIRQHLIKLAKSHF